MTPSSCRLSLLLLVGTILGGWSSQSAFAFAPAAPRIGGSKTINNSNNNNIVLRGCCQHHDHDANDQTTTAATQRPRFSSSSSPSRRQRLSSLFQRFNTLQSIGLNKDDEALTAGGVGGKIKSLHNPITYLGLSAFALVRWNALGRNPLYWFAVGFCIKWYRARYVFKIPVWDRQPNWNNIITSKEQEKDLKAFTCKNCGSTIFIAKTREFFFEGDTGIGGLGCFSCGAKGADNFIMDRDRIVEDVGDMDDYFEYERPLDFVSRAERRKVLKEAQGDEEKANQILLDRAESTDANVVDVQPVVEDVPETASPAEETAPTEAPAPPKASSPPPPAAPKPKPESKASDSDDGLDALDMDL